MVRILNVSDTHSDDPSKFKYIVDVANSQRADVVIHAGDVLGQKELHRYAVVYHEGNDRFMDWLPSEHRHIMRVDLEVKQNGGIDAIKEASDEDKDLQVLAERYDIYKPQIDALTKRYKSLGEFNAAWTKRDIERASKKLDEEMFYVFARLDNALGGCKCPVYFVRGNWDTDRFMNYKWKNLKFLNGVVNVKGINVAGAPNWNEVVHPIPGSDYKNRETDLMFGGDQPGSNEFKDWVKKEATLKELANLENRNEIPPRLLNKLSVYNRLKDKKIDYLVCHKGPSFLATEKKIIKKKEELVNYGSGIGLEQIIRDSKPTVISAGHIHGKSRIGRFDDGGQYVCTSDKAFTVSDIDAVTKQVVANGIKVFRFPDKKEAA
ncbi:MAG: metallophosphoesterase [Candidatus Woesearchaeota archaeon]|nr:metallophosphoesterase [Candidatus Woesearchaeota archaeon]